MAELYWSSILKQFQDYTPSAQKACSCLILLSKDRLDTIIMWIIHCSKLICIELGILYAKVINCS